jgi:hypothetical protein
VNDVIVAEIWGVTTSLSLSVAKLLKMPQCLYPVFNVLFGGVGCLGYLMVREGKTLEQATPMAIAAVATSLLMYKGISQPLKEELKKGDSANASKVS